ncbi:DHH family phosphoesterase [Natronomonas salsuginis]|uniref:Bifunctional oligoribonuclease/PAP phosphatase NrnA n=1 Tax=Natronomonas salsuginis TaxID=2217661 RepID=A0A4U5JB17_9EURY|nr:bifunctional oligoribonuclease/PAP phosphatase NrnA [Natronomonas salsuginis]TKR25366.1 bifunctional oligoribonuclease/PAP phosphatase NrnA [Natronomonas salsuginis]
MDRLVLGYDAVGASFVERLADQPGELVVLTPDTERAESLRDGEIAARHVDIGNVDDVRTVAGDIDSVVVAPLGSDELRTAVSTARSAYPSAFLMVCLGGETTADDRRNVESVADRIVDLSADVGEAVLDRAGDPGLRLRKLREVFDEMDGRLAVVAHDNPDPDAIASAIGLRRLAMEFGVDAEACYHGEISHQENRALVNLFGFELTNLPSDADLSSFDVFALVDHSRPGVNDGLPEGTPVDIVIDHHPPRDPVSAKFVDLRSDVGATCTLIVGYLDRFGIEPTEELASGLLYGIRTDTLEFSRGVSIADFDAAAGLVELADTDRLRQVESPSVSTETLGILGKAISNRTVQDDVLTTCVGPISDRDTLAQAADRLLAMDSITTTLVFGYTEDTVFASARARGVERDLGEILRDAFGQIGSAGGHADMAGAQIPVGILTDETADDDERGDVITDVITDRFFEALGIVPDYPATFVYTDSGDGDDRLN